MTTYREEPPVQWTDMSASFWFDRETAWSPGWCAVMTRNLEYLKLLAYGEGTYTGDVPHSHLGAEDSHAAPVNGLNLLGSSNPTGASMDARGEYNEWTTSGFYDADGLAYAQGGMRGDYFFQYLYFPDFNAQYAPRVLGKGADLTLSLFVRARDTSDFGLLELGISGTKQGALSVGSAGAGTTDVIVSSPGDLIPGQRAILSGSDLTTSWKRFYVVIKDAGGSLYDSPRFLVRVKEGFTHEILVGGCMVTQGRRLYPWCPSPADQPFTGAPNDFIGGHAGWQNMPSGLPLMDWTVSMTNAVELEAY